MVLLKASPPRPVPGKASRCRLKTEVQVLVFGLSGWREGHAVSNRRGWLPNRRQIQFPTVTPG